MHGTSLTNIVSTLIGEFLTSNVTSVEQNPSQSSLNKLKQDFGLIMYNSGFILTEYSRTPWREHDRA